MGILRLLLAISVIASHAGPIFGSTLLPGNFAVEVFFMISGFYMALVLSSKYVGSSSTLTFYTNRFLRLYPTFLLITVIAWAGFVVPWLRSGTVPANSWMEPYAQMNWLPKLGLIFSNWTMIGHDLRCLFHWSPDSGFMFFHSPEMGPSADGAKWAADFGTIRQAWSIGLEIWFYLLVPFLARLRLPWLVAIGLGSALTKVVMERSGIPTYCFFPAQLVYFVVGMIAYRLGGGLTRTPTVHRSGWALASLLIILAIAFPFIRSESMQWIYYTLFAFGLPVIFAASKSHKLDRWLGNLSYPVYLSHLIVLKAVGSLVKSDHVAVVTMLGTVAISIAIVHFIEEPFDLWRQRRVRDKVAEEAS